MEVTKNVGGRPRRFNNADEIEVVAEQYFNRCKTDDEPYTITGICLALEIDRHTLLDYKTKIDKIIDLDYREIKDKDKREKLKIDKIEYKRFSTTIKRIVMKCQNYTEIQLMRGKSPIGAIFNLKNNYGWKDKQEIDQNITGLDLSGIHKNLNK